MHPYIAKAHRFLYQQLKSLDASYQRERTRLKSTIEALENHDESRVVPSMGTRTQTKRRSSKQEAVFARVNPSPDEHRPSISSVLLEAVRAQTQPFQPVDLRGYVDTRHPGLTSKITAKRISKELYALRVRGVVAVQKRGTKGLPSTYLLMEYTKK